MLEGTEVAEFGVWMTPAPSDPKGEWAGDGSEDATACGRAIEGVGVGVGPEAGEFGKGGGMASLAGSTPKAAAGGAAGAVVG